MISQDVEFTFGYQIAMRSIGKLSVRDIASDLGADLPKADRLLSRWKSKSDEIIGILLSRAVSSKSLIDLDWSFGVTAASNDTNHVGKTYLQLKLTLRESSSSAQQDVFMELSLDQFYRFLASVEKCKSYLDFVSPR